MTPHRFVTPAAEAAPAVDVLEREALVAGPGGERRRGPPRRASRLVWWALVGAAVVWSALASGVGR
ncbi:MAG: hypothetical protein ACRDZW_00620, partial [Acidimicrobiales bacterium]